MDSSLPGDAPPRLGQRVWRFRVAAGLSQRELALRMGVKQPTISQVETGKIVGPLHRLTVSGLANALGVTIDDLIAGDPVYANFDVDDSLPVPLAAALPSAVPLIGRDDDEEAVAALLRGDARLVTLTGPGGVGKTQLAMHVARSLEPDFPAGVFLIPLVASRDAGGVVSAVARGVGLREDGAHSLRSRLLRDLPAGRVLLVLDNVEQAVAAVADLCGDILAVYPQAALLLTSRRRLNVRGERVYPVRPLALPAVNQAISPASIAASPAVALYAQRARVVVPTFTLTAANAARVAAICQRLDGLPLAIELAAARTGVFGPRQLLEQLERRLAFLDAGARDLPPRQRSLRASIEWSVDLLAPAHKTLLHRLAIFTGGFTLDAASEVAGEAHPSQSDGDRPLVPSPAVVDGVQELLDQHLLTRTLAADGLPRFAMLETVHDYAQERLHASGEADALRRRHVQWAIALAEEADAALFGFAQEPWLQRLDAEWENIRAALGWAIETGDPHASLRLAAALTDYWYLRGMLSEGAGWLNWALALAGDAPVPGPLAAGRVRALAGASQLAQPRGDHAAAGARAEQGLALAKAIGDRPGEARSLALLANHALVQDDFVRAEALHRAALAMFHELDGEQRWLIAGLNNLSLIAYEQGDHQGALVLAGEALAAATEAGDAWGMTMAHQRLGDAVLGLGQLDLAAHHIGHSLRENHRYGLPWGLANALAAAASLAFADGATDEAVRLLAAAATVYQQLGVRVPPKLRPDWRHLVARAHEAMNDARYALVWQAGSALSADDAVAEALTVASRAASRPPELHSPARSARRRRRPLANVRARKSGTQPSRS